MMGEGRSSTSGHGERDQEVGATKIPSNCNLWHFTRGKGGGGEPPCRAGAWCLCFPFCFSINRWYKSRVLVVVTTGSETCHGEVWAAAAVVRRGHRLPCLELSGDNFVSGVLHSSVRRLGSEPVSPEECFTFRSGAWVRSGFA